MRDQLSDVDALATGTAFADVSFWRKVAVTGSEALDWLDNLLTADLSGLEAGHARQSLLLSPTGRIRALFICTLFDESPLLIQDPEQPKAIDALLDPYVLSSDVRLEDRTNTVELFAFPGRADLHDEAILTNASISTPSCLGSGADLLTPAEHHDQMLAGLRLGFRQVGDEVVESWRISAGFPKFGVDVFDDDLPQEAGLTGAVSFEKGCYLGQEAVAKVQNLGHPRRLVLRFVASGPISPGDPIVSDGNEVGEITSVTKRDGDWFALGRIKWEARGGSLSAANGVVLTMREGSDRKDNP